MKKTIALLLSLCLLFTVASGCAKQPKEIPPYFPHSDTLRLDAAKEDVIAAEGLVEESNWSGTYDRPNPVIIDGQEFGVTYSENSHNEMTCVYFKTQMQKDLDKEYKSIVKYFTKTYGKSNDYSNSTLPSSFAKLGGKEWSFKLDTGISCHIILQYSSTSDDKYGDQYTITFAASQKDA